MNLFCILLCCVIVLLSVKAEKKQVVCYWGSWSVYRNDNGHFGVNDMDPSLCTTIVYSFIGLNKKFEIDSLDTWADVNLGGFSNLTSLKDTYPSLKVTVAIGGWNEGSMKYSVVASDEEGRKKFADDVLKFLVYNGFDGFDLDWEYPTYRGGQKGDKENFPLLLKAIKERISPWNLTLSIAVPFEDELMESAYDIKSISNYVDYVNVMAYDYVASTSPVTGLSSPISIVNSTVRRWLEDGLPPDKLILGLQGFARSFALEDPNKHDIGAPVSSPGLEGYYTQEAGFLGYYEVLDALDSGMTEVYTDGTNYAYAGKDWITYETPKTIEEKTKLALELNLGGVMFWSIDLDDFRGLFGKAYPLLKAANDTISQ